MKELPLNTGFDATDKRIRAAISGLLIEKGVLPIGSQVNVLFASYNGYGLFCVMNGRTHTIGSHSGKDIEGMSLDSIIYSIPTDIGRELAFVPIDESRRNEVEKYVMPQKRHPERKRGKMLDIFYLNSFVVTVYDFIPLALQGYRVISG